VSYQEVTRACYDCRRHFITDHTYFRRASGVAWFVVWLTFNGCGVCAVALLRDVSPTAVLATLRAQAARLPEPYLPGRENCRVTRYHTDDWQPYPKYLPAERHHVGKDGTRHVAAQPRRPPAPQAA
jgi:hypothetical protein